MTHRALCAVGAAHALLLLALVGCQDRDFVFQADTNRVGVHLRFEVETPSKSDILFVVDNSGSMKLVQETLKQSIGDLLDQLAAKDSSYRIGLVSTDWFGFEEDCNGVRFLSDNPLIPGGNGITDGQEDVDEVGINGYLRVSQGNCSRGWGTGGIQGEEVKIDYPHDGARGRLLGAYDATQFTLDRFPELNADEQSAFASLVPTGRAGARYVIDRDAIQEESCGACRTVMGDESCECKKGDTCYDECAAGVAKALVTAYFNSNVEGLGTSGFGYESGLLTSMWAVGIEPAFALSGDDNQAINRPDSLVEKGQPNRYVHADASGQTIDESWVRDTALLAIMYISDEQDCSMPDYIFEQRSEFEQERGLPDGTMCYQEDAQPRFFEPSLMRRLVTAKKQTSSRIAAGFIGGLQKASPTDYYRGEAADCVYVTAPDQQPSSDCACWASADAIEADAWCNFTKHTVKSENACNALGGSRYIDFVTGIPRRTLESVCFADGDAVPGTAPRFDFGYALQRFANIITIACFDLDDAVRPASCRDTDDHPQECNPSAEIVVKRAEQLDAEAGVAPEPVPYAEPGSNQEGWYYEIPAPDSGQPARICLQGRDRMIGDAYDIFIVTQDEFDASR